MPTYTSVTAEDVLVKQPTETRYFSMDFSLLMATDETIEAASPAPVVEYTANTSDVDLIITEVDISGQTVVFWITGGTHGTRYRIQVTLMTNSGQILVGDGILVVQDR